VLKTTARLDRRRQVSVSFGGTLDSETMSRLAEQRARARLALLRATVSGKRPYAGRSRFFHLRLRVEESAQLPLTTSDVQPGEAPWPDCV